MSILSLNCSNFICFQPLSIILCFLVWRLFFLFWEFWSQTATRTSNIIIARRAYCVGTSLISLFVRRLSVCRPSHSVLDRDFAKDTCQDLPSRSKPDPFGTFCKTSPYGRQSGCPTWSFLLRKPKMSLFRIPFWISKQK